MKAVDQPQVIHQNIHQNIHLSIHPPIRTSIHPAVTDHSVFFCIFFLLSFIFLTQPPTGASRNELLICVQRCRGLRSRSSSSTSPYVVYKFFNFPDYPTATVDDSGEPEFNDLKSYSVLMDDDLDRFLKTEGLQFYVFDYKEEQLDAYLGKTRVPLLSLTQDQEVSGELYEGFIGIQVKKTLIILSGVAQSYWARL